MLGQLDHPLTTALAYWGAAYLEMFKGEPERTLAAAEMELSTAKEYQFPLLIAQAGFQIGWARFRLGQPESGLRDMENAITAIRQTGAEMGLPYLVALHAEALAEFGKADEAERAILASIELGRANGTYFQLAEVLRIEACIRERQGAGADEVQQMLRKAAHVATLQRSATGRLRVSIELARRLRKRKQVNEAREVLASQRELIAKLGDCPDARAARDLLS